MGFVGNNQVCQVSVFFTQDVQQVMNTLYFYTTEEMLPSELSLITSTIGNFAITHWLPLMSNLVHFEGVKAQRLGSPTDYVSYWYPLTSSWGGNANSAMPNNVTLAIAFKTGLSGRSNQGRNYWIGLTENQVVNNSVSSGFVTDCLDTYVDMKSTVYAASGAAHCVYSRYHNGDERVSGIYTEIETYTVVNTTIDSMRRRLPGRGR